MLRQAVLLFVICGSFCSSTQAALHPLELRKCTLAPDLDDGKKSRDTYGSFFASFNNVLGPIVHIPYDNTFVQQSLTREFHIHTVRHPGGTVANYWNLSAGNFMPGYYGKDYDEIAQQFPSETFTPLNFLKHVAPQLSDAARNGNGPLKIVFDLNLLTINDTEAVLSQVDLLIDSFTAAGYDPLTQLKYFELGNEFYLTNHYGWRIPNASVYLELAAPLIAYIRQKLPNAKIAMVSARCTNDCSWNHPLIAASSDLFDSVTIHDYSGKFGKRQVTANTGADARFTINHGPMMLPKYAQYVRNNFGPNKTVWMTEFNLGAGTLKSANVSYSALHFMFIANYLFTGLCETSNTFEIMMLHMTWAQAGNGWGTHQTPMQLPSTSAFQNPSASNQYNILGQMYSQLNDLAMDTFSTAYCWKRDGAASANACPSGSFYGNQTIPCLHGVTFSDAQPNNRSSFAKSSPVFGAVLLNGCELEALVTVENPKPQQRQRAVGNSSAVWSYWVYTFDQAGGFVGARSGCEPGPPLWKCGPATATATTAKCEAGLTAGCAVKLPPLSMAFAILTGQDAI